jgi:hypothetical protein
VTRDLLMRDASLSGLEVSGAGLEEAFLTLTAAPAREQELATAGGAR